AVVTVAPNPSQPVAIGRGPYTSTHDPNRTCSSTTKDHQRRSRGPRAAPAKVQRTMVPPYQNATKGKEPLGQSSAHAIAPRPPATRPAKAPVLSRFVGAAFRTAQTITAKGTTAMMGMESRHWSRRSPITRWLQWEVGTEIRFTAARAIKAANGTATKNIRE